MGAKFSQKVLKWMAQHSICIITHPMCTGVTFWLLVGSENDNFVAVQKSWWKNFFTMHKRMVSTKTSGLPSLVAEKRLLFCYRNMNFSSRN